MRCNLRHVSTYESLLREWEEKESELKEDRAQKIALLEGQLRMLRLEQAMLEPPHSGETT